MKLLFIAVLKSYVGATLHSLCVPTGLGGKVEFDVCTNFVFTHGVVIAITLVEDGAGDGVARV